jgi:hypothetical protein
MGYDADSTYWPHSQKPHAVFSFLVVVNINKLSYAFHWFTRIFIIEIFKHFNDIKTYRILKCKYIVEIVWSAALSTLYFVASVNVPRRWEVTVHPHNTRPISVDTAQHTLQCTNGSLATVLTRVRTWAYKHACPRQSAHTLHWTCKQEVHKWRKLIMFDRVCISLSVPWVLAHTVQ